MKITARRRPAQFSDAQLERDIQLSRRALVKAPDRHGRIAAWTVMRTLLLQRSPATIARMERERGLS
jgi:hypothetical protein